MRCASTPRLSRPTYSTTQVMAQDTVGKAGGRSGSKGGDRCYFCSAPCCGRSSQASFPLADCAISPVLAQTTRHAEKTSSRPSYPTDPNLDQGGHRSVPPPTRFGPRERGCKAGGAEPGVLADAPRTILREDRHRHGALAEPLGHSLGGRRGGVST